MNTLTRLAATAAMTAGLAGFALPGYAADIAVPSAGAAEVQVAANDDHSSYVKKAEREMSEWKDKVVDYGQKAKKKSEKAADAASEKLANAWDEVEQNWAKLKEAGKDAGQSGWQRAKDAYEASKQKLQETWDEVSS